ncbi:MAG TPA: tetratricopeptide repeat protein, partial [bacterium]
MCGKIIIPVAAFRPIPILLALLFALAHHAAGQPADSLRLVHHTPQPLTADLATEISPELSPNQKYLIYGSQAGGNYDIWVRPLAGGIAVPLTNHPADDHSPQWSSKGKVVAFVSHRDDIEGDIFALYLEESRDRLRAAKIAPLVSDSGPQSFPSHSRDGRYLVYQDGGAAQARLILLDLRRGKKTILTEPGYLQPRFSPVDDRILCLKSGDGDSPGALCILQMHDLKNPTPEIQVVYDGLFPAAFPAWSPDGESFVAALTNHDLDGDGMLTYLDRAQLYRFDPDDEGYGYRLLFPGDSRATYPCWGTDDFVYFASDPRGNLDLYRLPANGAIPPAPSAEAGFQFALSLGREAELLGRSLRRDESLAILFALERVRMYFPRNRTMAARSLLESARLSVKMGAQDEAIASLRKLVRGYSDQGEAVGQGLIDYHFLVHRAAIAPEDEIAAANPASLIANLEDVQRQFSDQPTVLARCRWLSGRIWLALGDSGKARELFDSILRDFPGLDEWAAQALLSKASLIEKSGDWEGALRLYNELLQKYPHEIAPIERAVQRIFSIELQGSEADPILSELANQQESPALAAGAIRRLAEFSLQSADTNGAIIEYNRLRGLTEASPTSFVRQTFAEGWMAAAALEAQQGRMEAALTRLAEVQESCSDLQDGFYSRKARQLRISFLTKQAEDAATRGQDRIAMRFFQRALDLDPRSVPLHRGYIAAAFSAGDLPRVTEEYRQMRSSQENDPVYLYSLGLCLSYIAGNNRRFLAQSNELLEAAMAQQPDLTFGYLTLGYNYGLMEKLAGKKGRRQNWMERAIAILQLGLAVNDENKDPGLEGQLWLDLGNSYYELGEYGYARALQAYQQREIYDSTFASPVQAALTFEKMGRAAAMTSDEASALKSYQQSLEHWRLAEHPSAERRLLLRLAELHQVSGNFDLSIEYYKQAAALAQAKGLKADSAKWLTNCSYNALQMDKIAEAAAYASQALPLLGDIKTSFEDSIRNPLALEILGITIPLWDFGFLGAGSPASARGFSDQENKQLTLSILQEVHEKQGDFVAARREAFRRLASAVERKDREMEARLWSEIGFLDWRLGDPTLARRGFLR